MVLQRREISIICLVIISTLLLFKPDNRCEVFGLDNSEIQPYLSASDLILVKSHIIQIDIQTSEEIYVTEIYNIENQENVSISSVDLWLNHSCSNITVQDGTGNLDFYELVQTTAHCLVSLDLRQPLEMNESTVFYVYYNLDLMPLYVDATDYFYFEYSSTINFVTLNHYLSVKLPENSYIHEEAGLTSIYPSNHTQNVAGKRLIISWSLHNLNPTVNPIYILRFDPPSLEKSNLPIWAFIVGPLAGISIGVASTYFLMRRREGKSMKDMGVLFLNESQKILLTILKESGGKIAQSDLGRNAAFTRAKTSRNLLLLEEQGLIRKEKWGRNAIVYLTKSGEKVIE